LQRNIYASATAYRALAGSALLA